MIPLTLTFDFDLILGSFLTFFWVLMDYFGVGVGLKNFFGSTDVVEQLLFSIVSSILTFDFDFLLFGALMCNFWGQSRVENFLGVKLCFEKLLFSIVLSSYIYGFCFINFALFLHYHVVLSHKESVDHFGYFRGLNMSLFGIFRLLKK